VSLEIERWVGKRDSEICEIKRGHLLPRLLSAIVQYDCAELLTVGN
jgi:hypothetical protein